MLVRNHDKYEKVVKKYAERIAGISNVNNVDLGVAEDMFFANFRMATNYPGGGTVTAEEYAKIKKDIDDMYEDQ